MTVVLSELGAASGEYFEKVEELEHAREGCPVVNGTGAIGGDTALDPVVRSPVDFKK